MTHERRHDCLLKKVQFTALSITVGFQGAQMKLAFFDDFKVGVVAGDSVVDVTDVVKHISRLGPQDVMRGAIERVDSLEGKLPDAGATAPPARRSRKKEAGSPCGPTRQKVQSSQANSGCMLSGARRVHPVIVGRSTANRPLLPKPINDNLLMLARCPHGLGQLAGETGS